MTTKYFFLALYICVCVLLPKFCLAGVRISEIMFDPSGGDTNHEWIEIENDSTESVDISDWKLLEGTSNHSLTSVVGGSVIPAHGFAIVADNASTFQVDWPDFSGILFDSVFSLSNSGETIALKDLSGAVVDEVTYTASLGGNGDGNSLSGGGSVWAVSTPSPGTVTSDSVHQNTDSTLDDTQEQQGSTTNDSQNSSNEPKDKGSQNTIKIKKTSAKITIPSGTLLYDDSIVLAAKVVNSEGRLADHGWLYWNFGDGESFTSVNTDPVVHIFAYPGRYSIQLEYYEQYYDHIPVASDRVTVSIGIPKIEFNDDGFALSLKNAGKTDIDISGWKYVSSEQSREILADTLNAVYTFPKGSVLLSGSLIILEKAKVKLAGGEYGLFYANGISVPLSVPEIIETVQPVASSHQEVTQNTSNVASPEIAATLETEVVPTDVPSNEINQPPVESLGAPVESNQKNTHKQLSQQAILAGGIVLVAIGLIVYVGKKIGATNETTQPDELSDDFD